MKGIPFALFRWALFVVLPVVSSPAFADCRALLARFPGRQIRVVRFD